MHGWAYTVLKLTTGYIIVPGEQQGTKKKLAKSLYNIDVLLCPDPSCISLDT